MNNTLAIHSRKLAIYLQCKGFVLVGVEPNLKNRHKVFLFNNSERIQKIMIDYKQDEIFKDLLGQLSNK